MWTIGLTRTGNLVGLNLEQWEQLAEATQKDRLRDAESVLRTAGADYVAEDLPSCNQMFAEIDRRISEAEWPNAISALKTGEGEAVVIKDGSGRAAMQ